MSKKYQQQEESQVDTGADIPAGTENVEQSTETDAGADTPAEPDATGEAQSTEPEAPEAKAIGIGQFVRHLLKNSTKTNGEILELVLKTYEGSKTTPACIAWYKTDMRKKGLLDGLNSRGKNKTVAFSAEELAELCK
jgi:hypothetical protein